MTNERTFWQMCPHHYNNEDLYQAFKERLMRECDVNERNEGAKLIDWSAKE